MRSFFWQSDVKAHRKKEKKKKKWSQYLLSPLSCYLLSCSLTSDCQETDTLDQYNVTCQFDLNKLEKIKVKK